MTTKRNTNLSLQPLNTLKVVIVLAAIGFRSSIFAIGLSGAVTPSVQSAAECEQNTPRGVRDLHRIAIYGEDDRRPLSQFPTCRAGSAPTINCLTRAERQQVTACAGEVSCSTLNDPRLRVSSTGFIVEGNSAAPYVVTARHLLYGQHEGVYSQNSIVDPTKCEFRSFTGKTVRINGASVQENIRVMGAPFSRVSDRMALRLNQAVGNCSPIPFVENDAAISAETPMIAVTIPQSDQTQLDPTTAVAYNCNLVRMAPNRRDDVGGYISSCDILGGASGGLNLVRDDRGNLQILGMILSESGRDRGTYASYSTRLNQASFEMLRNPSDFARFEPPPPNPPQSNPEAVSRNPNQPSRTYQPSSGKRN